MKLTEEEKQKALLDINQKFSPITCPMCKKATGFDLGDDIFHLIALNIKDNTADLGNFARIESVLTVCKNCGYIALFKK